MPYAGVVLHKQNKYIKSFESMGATDTEHAVSLNDVKIKRDSVFDKLLDIGVLYECDNGLFYMSADSAERLKRNRTSFDLWRL